MNISRTGEGGNDDTTMPIHSPSHPIYRQKLSAEQKKFEDSHQANVVRILEEGSVRIERSDAQATLRNEAMRRTQEEERETARIEQEEEEELRLLNEQIAQLDAERFAFQNNTHQIQKEVEAQKKKQTKEMAEKNSQVLKCHAEMAKLTKQFKKDERDLDALNVKCDELGFKFGMDTSAKDDPNSTVEEERKSGAVVLTFSKIDPLDPSREFFLYFTKYEFKSPYKFTVVRAAPNFPEFKTLSTEAKSVKELIEISKECWLRLIEKGRSK